jgi:hypothetical protein
MDEYVIAIIRLEYYDRSIGKTDRVAIAADEFEFTERFFLTVMSRHCPFLMNENANSLLKRKTTALYI